MQWKALLGLALLTQQAQALLRFACSQLVIERFDPLLNPGQVSPHLHQVVGGNAFNVTMDPANDLPSLSSCTTCTFSEDFSNYWTAVLYFKHPNGSFHRVKQLPGQYLGNPNGGMTVYYIQQGSGKNTAFTKGFRMIVGDAMVRAMNSSSPEATSLNFRCLDANYGNSGVTGAPGTDSNSLPAGKCKGGIRSQIIYPSCWDGKNVDSADHKSHTAYPSGGRCPSSHPVQVPSLFIETVWDTTEFNSMWPDGTTQPFVFSMGDPIGVAQHADYMFGWQGDSLQRAMDSCNDFGGSCSTLKTQSVDAINKCSQSSRVDEQYDGWLAKLPGCNPIQSGPGRAVPQGDCGAPTTYLPGGPSGPAGGGSPAVAPPTTGSSPPTTGGGGATPPYTGGTPPATGGGGGATVAHYGQCGGNGYSGATTCESPYTCKKQNDYYSQCL